MFTPEVGPEHLAEHQLAVRQFPQQEIGDAVLARGADHQVRVGHLRFVEVPGDDLLGDLFCRGARIDDATHGIDQFSPTAVVEGDRECESRVVLRELERLVHAPDQPLRDPPVAAPREADPDVALVQLVAALEQDLFVEVDEELHLLLGAPPVLGREGVDGEPVDADLVGALEHVEQGALASLVALGAGKALLLRPAPVAVHDAGNVAGDPGGIEVDGKHTTKTTG